MMDSDYWMYFVGSATLAATNREIYVAKSSDGISWTKQNSGNAIVTVGGGGDEDEEWAYAPYVCEDSPLMIGLCLCWHGCRFRLLYHACDLN